jgi:hypothetical protein
MEMKARINAPFFKKLIVLFLLLVLESRTNDKNSSFWLFYQENIVCGILVRAEVDNHIPT